MILVNTGTRLGYEDYHGEIYSEEHEFLTEWHYDKRQNKYIARLPKKDGGYKRFYANSPLVLGFDIAQWLKKIKANELKNQS